MNTFINRWARALSVTAAAAIVLTAGAADALPNSTSRASVPTDAVTNVVDRTDDAVSVVLGDCPMEPNVPGDTGATPASDGTARDGDGDGNGQTGTGDGAGDGVDVTVGSNGAGGGTGLDIGVGTGVGSATDPTAGDGTGTPATDPDPGTGGGDIGDGTGDQPGTGTPPAPGTGGTGGTASGRAQLVDLDALFGSSGLTVDVPASDGSLIDLGVGRPAAGDPDALIDVMGDTDDLDATTVDVADVRAIDGLDGVDTGVIDVGSTDGVLDGSLLGQGTADHTVATPSGLLGDVVVNANDTAAGHGDIGTVDTSAPLVNVVAPVSADSGLLG